MPRLSQTKHSYYRTTLLRLGQPNGSSPVVTRRKSVACEHKEADGRAVPDDYRTCTTLLRIRLGQPKVSSPLEHKRGGVLCFVGTSKGFQAPVSTNEADLSAVPDEAQLL